MLKGNHGDYGANNVKILFDDHDDHNEKKGREGEIILQQNKKGVLVVVGR